MFSVITTSIVFSTSISTASASLGLFDEEHFDIWVQSSNGQLSIGSISEDGVPINSQHAVFGAELGEDPEFPFSAFEPGFQTDQFGFGALTALTFTVLDGLAAWNGSGFDAAAETITIAFGPESMTTGANSTPGFSFTTDASGLLHMHFDYTLNAAMLDPAPGIYLLAMSLSGVNPIHAESNLFYIVFNIGSSERDHELAMEWVEMNLVPAPGVMSLLVASSLLQRQRRRS